MNRYDKLSWRERQIMDAVYEMGEATVAEVRSAIEDAPSYSAVRATIRILEEKGQLHHIRDGRRYVYRPAVARKRLRQRVLDRMLSTFFDGSTEAAVAALLDLSGKKLSKEELDRMAERIEAARKEGR